MMHAVLIIDSFNVTMTRTLFDSGTRSSTATSGNIFVWSPEPTRWPHEEFHRLRESLQKLSDTVEEFREWVRLQSSLRVSFFGIHRGPEPKRLRAQVHGSVSFTRVPSYARSPKRNSRYHARYRSHRRARALPFKR
jgi:hypothetical protein